MLIVNMANNMVMATATDSAVKKGSDILDGERIVMGGIESGLILQFLYSVLYDGTYQDYVSYLTHIDGITTLNKLSIPIFIYRKVRITELKKNGSNLIYSEYPQFKQDNAALGVYSSVVKDAIVARIINVKGQIDSIEASINAAEDYEAVDLISIDLI